MASPLHLLSLLSLSFFLCMMTRQCLATVYPIGAAAGWTTPSRANINYTEWASTTVFKIGDILEFNYVPKAHSVLEVTRSDFRYCNKTNPLVTHDDPSGKTTIELTKPGNHYFIDGIGHHCEEGQKFQAKVLSAPASGSISSSPSVGNFAPALAPSASSAFEPSASPTAAPPATSAACSPAAVSITFLLSCLYVALINPPTSS